MKMEKVFDVYVSTDYDSFKVLDGNRDPEKNSRIKKIERSIDKVGFIEAPILVNEHYEVIDGQARLAVAKKHGYPIYFCILPGKGIEECIALNQSSTAWTIMDYIHSYAAQGNENYIILEDCIKKYPNVKMRPIIYALAGIVEARNRLKNGGFVVRDDFYETAGEKLEWLTYNADIFKNIKGSVDQFQTAMLFCYDSPDIRRERLIAKIREKKYKLQSYQSMDDWLQAISDIYNNGLSVKNEVYLKEKYKKEMADRYEWYVVLHGEDE